MSGETTKRRNDETLDAVLEKMRNFDAKSGGKLYSWQVVDGFLTLFAERIEAATKRERSMLKANLARVRELEGLLGGAADALLGAAIRRREGRTEAPRQNGDAQGAAGNAGALREALAALLAWCEAHTGACAIRVAPVPDDEEAVWAEHDRAMERARAALGASEGGGAGRTATQEKGGEG